MGGTDPAGAPLRRTWDASALIAALIGLLALCVSGYTAYIQREQVRAQVWPYLEPGLSGSKREIILVNKGVGPAIVRSLQIYVDDKPQRNWEAVFAALSLKFERTPPYSTVNGVVLSGGDHIDQVIFQSVDDFNAYAHQAHRLNMRLCYCSTLNECWLRDERENDPARLFTAAATCPPKSADDFVDNIAAQAIPPAKSGP